MEVRGIGGCGEQIARHTLLKKGYKILKANYRTPYGEIDVIARKGNLIVFVEVKTRRSERFGLGEESITLMKKKHIIKAAQYWILENYIPPQIRFDIIIVHQNNLGSFKVYHFKNAIME
jgi:putative endonuclease|uniref:UPF0102 protein ENL96_00595 n=1 Tax=candidate division CPR3 bacterium TaxID=2268181 RepID=A0A7C5YUL2_UNCC3